MCFTLLGLVGLLMLLPELTPSSASAASLVVAPLSPDDPALSLDISTVDLELFSGSTFQNDFDESYLTINTKTNSPYGYALYLNMADANTCLRHTSDIGTACASIASNAKFSAGNPKSNVNEWGYSLNGGTTYYAPLAAGSSTAIAPAGTGIRLYEIATLPGGDYVVVAFGAKASSALKPGSYVGQMVLTAAPNAPPEPIIYSVSPATGVAGDTITITGAILQTAHRVQVGSTDCTSATIVDEYTITCVVPAGTPGATVNVTVTTWGGSAIAPSSFTYDNPIPTAQWVKGPNFKGGATSAHLYNISLDANMILVVNKDSFGNYPGVSCDYDAGQWCNAVTVKSSTLAAYKAAPAGTEIAEDDILGYWVYIPRFAYEVQRYHAWNKPVCGNNQAGAAYADADCTSAAYQARFDIRFELASDTKKIPDPGDAGCSTPPASALAANLYTGGTDYRTDCGVSRTYGAATGTTWATHPAFTFGSTELDGLWIGKFETTGSIAAPTVKPNLKSQISQTIGEQYTIAKSIGVADAANTGGSTAATTQNSHNLATMKSRMLKNSEWGAAAYLATSVYGSNGKMVMINSAYTSMADGNGNASQYGITGCGPSTATSTSTYADATINTSGAVPVATSCSSGNPQRNYWGSIGQTASTTQNVYGIYDMSGGAYEYVMGYYGTGNSATNMATLPPANYLDNYGATTNVRPTWASSTTVQYYNFDRCAWDATPASPTTATSLFKCGGHANYETTFVQSVSTVTQSWGSDNSIFVYSTSPWFLRGGYSSAGSDAGLFVSSYYTGVANMRYGFRPSFSAY